MRQKCFPEGTDRFRAPEAPAAPPSGRPLSQNQWPINQIISAVLFPLPGRSDGAVMRLAGSAKDTSFEYAASSSPYWATPVKRSLRKTPARLRFWTSHSRASSLIARDGESGKRFRQIPGRGLQVSESTIRREIQVHLERSGRPSMLYTTITAT